jgi:D-alanyl-D-alanine carboxypeptidase (penicillin-binding protein 5/6)
MVTLLGEPDDAHRLADAVALFHWSASQYALQTALPAGRVLAHATVPYHDGKLALLTSGAVTASLRIGAKITTRVTAPRSVERPVSRGQILGEVRVAADGQAVGARHLVAATSFAKVGLVSKVGYQLHRAWHWLTSRL